MINRPTVGSLYSGIGGGDLGFERAGFRLVWQAESDPWRAKVLAAHWPDVTRYRFVEEAGAFGADPVDLLYAGLPSGDPGWLTPIWPMVAQLTPAILVIETGGRCADALGQAFDRFGYYGGGIALACEATRREGSIRRARSFAIARHGCREGLAELLDLAEQVDHPVMDETASASPRTIPEMLEALVGLPLGWTCVCMPATPGDCEESSARLVAANECLSPALAQWLGAYLLALRPHAAVAVPVEA